MKTYNWAILGSGAIANRFAETMKANKRDIYSVANRTYENACKLAENFGINKVYQNVDDLFLDDQVDVVYIASPHNTHISYIKKALEAGKHVLCEKAITLNSSELAEAIQLAKDKNLILAEAMTIYHMPLYRNLHERIVKGDFGKLELVQMNFGSFKEYDPNSRFYSKNLAGGALLDIGVYALSFVRWFMELKESELSSQVKLAESGVDEKVSIILKNQEDQMATVSLSLHAKQPKRGLLSFEKAYVEIYEYPRGTQAKITYLDGTYEQIEVGSYDLALFYEFEDMERSVELAKNMMYLDYTEDVMDIMTSLRQDWQLFYPEEG
ncbi:Gfo/Idh/MocA family oxidoreductase [Streptococcaceae bacterium ESL0729]|nr:Gfo/Idh/MocA family oxidoreductase [Streptococcaceae bacterium ESL0729]